MTIFTFRSNSYRIESSRFRIKGAACSREVVRESYIKIKNGYGKNHNHLMNSFEVCSKLIQSTSKIK